MFLNLRNLRNPAQTKLNPSLLWPQRWQLRCLKGPRCFKLGHYPSLSILPSPCQNFNLRKRLITLHRSSSGVGFRAVHIPIPAIHRASAMHALLSEVAPVLLLANAGTKIRKALLIQVKCITVREDYREDEAIPGTHPCTLHSPLLSWHRDASAAGWSW